MVTKMLLDQVNIMNKYGTQQRCLKSNAKLPDLVSIDLQMQAPVFHVVAPSSSRYIGSLSREFLSMIPDNVKNGLVSISNGLPRMEKMSLFGV